jgi:hypothetical protein
MVRASTSAALNVDKARAGTVLAAEMSASAARWIAIIAAIDPKGEGLRLMGEGLKLRGEGLKLRGAVATELLHKSS